VLHFHNSFFRSTIRGGRCQCTRARLAENEEGSEAQSADRRGRFPNPVDELVATGGTAEAACKLLKKIGANVLAACFIIDLPDLGGAEKIKKLGVPVRTLVSSEGY
jgi:orotate phosphoribosyltransferase